MVNRRRPTRSVDGNLLSLGATRGLGTSAVALVLKTSVWTVRRILLSGELVPDMPSSPAGHARYSLLAVAEYMRMRKMPISADLEYWLATEAGMKRGTHDHG